MRRRRGRGRLAPGGSATAARADEDGAERRGGQSRRDVASREPLSGLVSRRRVVRAAARPGGRCGSASLRARRSGRLRLAGRDRGVRVEQVTDLCDPPSVCSVEYVQERVELDRCVAVRPFQCLVRVEERPVLRPRPATRRRRMGGSRGCFPRSWRYQLEPRPRGGIATWKPFISSTTTTRINVNAPPTSGPPHPGLCSGAPGSRCSGRSRARRCVRRGW